MFKVRKDSIIKAVSFFFFPSKILGTFPFREKENKFVLSNGLLLHSVFVCLVNVGAVLYFNIFGLVIAKQTYMTYCLNYFYTFMTAFLPICALCGMIRFTADFNACVRTFREVEGLKVRFGDKATFICKMKYFYVQCLLACTQLIFGYAENYVTDVDFVQASITTTFFESLFLQMLTVVHGFSGMLDVCSHLLESCSNELLALHEFPSLSISSVLARTARLEVLIQAYNRMCSSCMTFNTNQRHTILLVILISFLIIIIESYELVDVLWAWKKIPKFFTAVMKLSWLCGCFYLIWRIVGSCYECSQKAKEFNILLYQLMIDDKTNDITNNKKLQLHISMKREVVFTACGFFTLDYTLVHSMIAAATTYLVILIQFGNNDTKSSSSVNDITSTTVASTVASPS